MKTRIKLHLAMAAALLTATFHRVTQPNTLALGNIADAPPDVTQPAQQQQQQQQRADAGLADENAALRKENEKLRAALPKNNAAIREKMAAGLSREQAEAALRNQAKFDARKKEAKK